MQFNGRLKRTPLVCPKLASDAAPLLGFPAVGVFVPETAWALFARSYILFGGGPRLSDVVRPGRGSVALSFLIRCGPCAFCGSAPYSSVAIRARLLPACAENLRGPFLLHNGHPHAVRRVISTSPFLPGSLLLPSWFCPPPIKPRPSPRLPPGPCFPWPTPIRLPTCSPPSVSIEPPIQLSSLPLHWPGAGSRRPPMATPNDRCRPMATSNPPFMR